MLILFRVYSSYKQNEFLKTVLKSIYKLEIQLLKKIYIYNIYYVYIRMKGDRIPNSLVTCCRERQHRYNINFIYVYCI